MKYSTAMEKEIEKYNFETAKRIKSYEDSNPKHRNQKAYERFKSKVTDYSSGKKCSYGDKQKSCDPGCRFWESCIKGKHESEWKGEIENARSNTASKSNPDE